ncbi:MAG: hypothetical protein HY321_13805 [Armatimonadetes bacterium]|nr:hypothetical protein [Armatimonadota bacterium]
MIASRTVEARPRTELGRRLAEIRARIIASGEPLLDWHGLSDEVAKRRGEGRSAVRILSIHPRSAEP